MAILYRFILCVVLSSFLSYQVFCQEIFEGRVLDEQNQPIENVLFLNPQTKKILGESNARGEVTLNWNANKDVLISRLNYYVHKTKLKPNFTIYLKEQSQELQGVITLGTRSLNRVITESPVPIDVINYKQIVNLSGRADLTSNLSYLVPSFNFNKQTGADGADHLEIGTLRGLGPDQTLVLINGKRRHPTALVALFGPRGRGNSGVDLNAFPSSIVSDIEVLRDGASAQYGSDAIAGVINIKLKKNASKWNLATGISTYYDYDYNTSLFNADNQYYSGNLLDGNTLFLNINKGWGLGNNGGFINVSLDVLQQDKSLRQANPKDGLPINTGQRAFSTPSNNNISMFYNLELPLTASKNPVILYSFGGYNNKISDAFAFSRNWSLRPNRFPRNSDGSLIFVPEIMRITTDSTKQIYYNPHFQAAVVDASHVIGLKGTTRNQWNWEISNTIGFNDFHFYGSQTFNASIIGQSKPNNFDDGGFNFTQIIQNVDFTKSFGKGVIKNNLNLSFGGEVRTEFYNIYEGEVLSYKALPNSLGQAAGSQGLPGYSKSDIVSAQRFNLALYGDLDYKPFKIWLLNFAVRGEQYSDFGGVFIYKFAQLLKLSKFFNIRGSFSTGFRAPSLQQINYSNTLSSFSGGNLVQSRIVSNRENLARLAGIPKLKQETSVNYSLGFTWKPIKNLTLTLDAYLIKLKDRVVLSGLYNASNPGLPLNLVNELNVLNVATVRFFTNAVNTTNNGIDIVLDYNLLLNSSQSIKFLLAGNVQAVRLDQINVPSGLSGNQALIDNFFSTREQYFLKNSAPNAKFNFLIDYKVKRFDVGVRLTYFGLVELTGVGISGDGVNPVVATDANPNVFVPEVYTFSPKIVTDIFASFKVSNLVTVFAGADNVFNVHPDYGIVPAAKKAAYDNETGGPWDAVQMGYNGLRLFTKLVFNF